MEARISNRTKDQTVELPHHTHSQGNEGGINIKTTCNSQDNEAKR